MTSIFRTGEVVWIGERGWMRKESGSALDIGHLLI